MLECVYMYVISYHSEDSMYPCISYLWSVMSPYSNEGFLECCIAFLCSYPICLCVHLLCSISISWLSFLWFLSYPFLLTLIWSTLLQNPVNVCPLPSCSMLLCCKEYWQYNPYTSQFNHCRLLGISFSNMLTTMSFYGWLWQIWWFSSDRP